MAEEQKQEEVTLLDAVRLYCTAYSEHQKENTEESKKFVDAAFTQMLAISVREMQNPKVFEVAENQELLALENVRDLLGKGQTDLAIRYIEGFINNDESLGRLMTPLGYVGAFESAFKTAMRKHSVIAGFVIVEPIRQPDNTYTYRMITGGHHVADAVLSFHLRPLTDSLGKNIGPKKDFTEVVDIVRRAALNPQR